MAIRQEEKEAIKQQEEGVDERYEMKFLGISIKDIPDGAKLGYAVFFLTVVGAALFYAFSQVDQKKGKVSNKRRQNSPKQADKKGKAQ
ncbi:unnamed protein product [Sphagnum balticum]